ncbi:MAG: cupin domain-containing protein [Negativicutes bacterium]|nr:cupin domain-containing protein [Negativicutes bacterium]
MSIKEVKHYSSDTLTLQEDIPGVAMWAVSLDKVMLTYFEVQPHKCFEAHSHASEQITMVLEGELFFETDWKVYTVGKNEVIAISSNVVHSVFTREEPVKAVDAWAPVMNKYREQKLVREANSS